MQDDGEFDAYDISNNFAENAIRPFVVGRKNWLFSDTAKGAESSAIVYTLVETAKANGLNPHTYLLRLLENLPYLGRNFCQNDMDIFMPWQPAVQAACSATGSSKSAEGPLMRSPALSMAGYYALTDDTYLVHLNPMGSWAHDKRINEQSMNRMTLKRSKHPLTGNCIYALSILIPQNVYIR